MEYKVLVEKPMDLQKKLNQWRHDYHLQILTTDTVHHNNTLLITCVLTRIKKAAEDTGYLGYLESPPLP